MPLRRFAGFASLSLLALSSACSSATNPDKTGSSQAGLIVPVDYGDGDPCLVAFEGDYCPAECESCYTTSGGGGTGGGGGGDIGDSSCSTVRSRCQTAYNACTARCVAQHQSCACQGFCWDDYYRCTGSCYPPDGPAPSPNDCHGW